MTNRRTAINSQRPLQIDLLHQIGGDALAGSGFETEDPNRDFAVIEVVGPEPNAPEKE